MMDAQVRKDDRQIENGVFFSWFSPVLEIGCKRALVPDDLPTLPESFISHACFARLLESSIQKDQFANINDENSKSQTNTKQKESCSWINYDVHSRDEVRSAASMFPLLRAMIFSNCKSIINIFILKMLSCGLSFASPLLLGALVSYLGGNVSSANLSRGILLVTGLSLISILSAMVNVNSNARSLDIKLKLQSGLSCFIFERVIALPRYSWTDIQITPAQLLNFIQVDVEQVANFAQTVNDVWSLPVQIIVAFVLLYLQIQIAFLAGVAVILLMIPLNSYIAKKIGSNTNELMKSKDARVKLVMEALGNIAVVKMLSLESAILRSSNKFRDKELLYLQRRKYLDAICVFLWASTPILVPFVTFVTSVLIRGEDALTASQVITSIALLNMLIFPMNALPWVINGFMEARVSLCRLAMLLNAQDDKSLDVYCYLDAYVQHLTSQYQSYQQQHTHNHSLPVLEADLPVKVPSKWRFSTNRYLWSNPVTMAQATATDEKHDLQVGQETFTVSLQQDIIIPLRPSSASSHLSHLQTKKTLLSSIITLKQTTDNNSNNIINNSKRMANSYMNINDTNMNGVSNTENETEKMIVIAGPTGSGKTALLLSFLREMLSTVQYYSSNKNVAETTEKETENSVDNDESQLLLTLPQITTSTSSATSFVPNRKYTHKEDKHYLAIYDAILSLRQIHRQLQTQHISSALISHCFSFCAQSPAIFAGTIQDNILCGASYNPERYRTIYRGCALHWDFPEEQVKDASQLSGGQRLRVGVARALYHSEAQIILLDDPFAALDHATAMHLLSFLRQEMIAREKKTIVCATHSLHLFRTNHQTMKDVGDSNSNDMCTENNPTAQDLFLVLENGREIDRGNFMSLQERCVLFQQLVAAQETQTSVINLPTVAETIENESVNNIPNNANPPDQSNNNDTVTADTESKTATDCFENDRKIGVISHGVYLRYFQEMGLWLWCLVLLSTLVMQLSSTAMTFWLGMWASGDGMHISSVKNTYNQYGHITNYDNSHYSLQSEAREPYSARDFLVISSVIVGVNLIATLARSFLFAFAGLTAAKNMYNQLIQMLLKRADIQFFEMDEVPLSTDINTNVDSNNYTINSNSNSNNDDNNSNSHNDNDNIVEPRSAQNQLRKPNSDSKSGQIANRVGRDTNTIDDSLPFILNILLAQAFQLSGALLLMVYNDVFILLVLLLVGVIYHRLQDFYRQSSREFRRLDAAVRSPVYSIFQEITSAAASAALSASGTSSASSASSATAPAITIRCLRHNLVPVLRKKFHVRLNASMRVTLALSVAAQWLSMRLQMLGVVVTAGMAILILINRWTQLLPLSPALAGLSLLYSYNLVNNLNGLVNAVAETEQEMISVERVLSYIDLYPSNPSQRTMKLKEKEQNVAGNDNNGNISLQSFKYAALATNNNNDSDSGSDTDDNDTSNHHHEGDTGKLCCMCCTRHNFRDEGKSVDSVSSEWLTSLYNERYQHKDSDYQLTKELLSDDIFKDNSDSFNNRDQNMYVAPIAHEHMYSKDSKDSNAHHYHESKEDEYTEEWNPLHLQRIASLASKQGLVFDKVSMCYNQVKQHKHVTINNEHCDDKALALKEVSFVLQPGQRLAVVGRSGAGKSTLIRCLLALQPLAHGQVQFLGEDIFRWDIRLLRRYAVSTVTQKPVLFSASVRFNLDPNRRYVHNDESIYHVLEQVGLLKSISTEQFDIYDPSAIKVDNEKSNINHSWPQTQLQSFLDSEVVDGGTRFSAGQCMLLSVARALLQKPRLLILDEIGASLDRSSYLQVLTAVLSYVQQSDRQVMVLCICHRLEEVEEVRFATHMLRLEQGRVIDFRSLQYQK